MKFRSRSFVEKKKERRKTFFWFFIVAALVLIGSFFWFIYSDTFQIKQTTIKGNSYVGESRLRDIIDQNTSTRILGFIPKTNVLFYPKSEIIDQIQLIPEIKGTNYSRLENNVRFDIEERKPVFMYCGEEYPADNRCYFTDEAGFVFLESPTFNNFPYLRLYGSVQKPAYSIGEIVEEKNVIDFAQRVIAYLDGKAVYVDAVTSDRASLFFIVHVGDSKIYVSKKDSIESFVIKIEAVSKDLDMTVFLQNLDYLDLRLNTKVFLKEK